MIPWTICYRPVTYLSHCANQLLCSGKISVKKREETFILTYGFKSLDHGLEPCCWGLLHDNRRGFHWCEFTNDSKDHHMAE